MWKCVRCLLELPAQSVEPAIDAFGIYFVCPVCRRRNRLVNEGRSGHVSLQQPELSAPCSPTRPILRLGGDLFFRHEIRSRAFQIRVTRNCMIDVFHSDGSLEGDSAALQTNFLWIVAVASGKAKRGFSSPIKVLNTDFF